MGVGDVGLWGIESVNPIQGRMRLGGLAVGSPGGDAVSSIRCHVLLVAEREGSTAVGHSPELVPFTSHPHNLQLTSWSRGLLGKLAVAKLVKEPPPPPMQPEGSLPCSQEPATELHPKPHESNLHTPFFLKICLNVIPPIYDWVSQVLSSLQVLRLKLCIHLLPL
jgi:hypothetical protein